MIDVITAHSRPVRSWAEIAERAARIKRRNVFKRFFFSDSDAKKLEGLVAEISTSIQERIVVRQPRTSSSPRTC